MFGLGVWEIMLIVVLLVVVFGAGKLPDVGRNLGRGIRSFKKAVTQKNDDEDDDDPPQQLPK